MYVLTPLPFLAAVKLFHHHHLLLPLRRLDGYKHALLSSLCTGMRRPVVGQDMCADTPTVSGCPQAEQASAAAAAASSYPASSLP